MTTPTLQHLTQLKGGEPERNRKQGNCSGKKNRSEGGLLSFAASSTCVSCQSDTFYASQLVSAKCRMCTDRYRIMSTWQIVCCSLLMPKQSWPTEACTTPLKVCCGILHQDVSNRYFKLSKLGSGTSMNQTCLSSISYRINIWIIRSQHLKLAVVLLKPFLSHICFEVGSLSCWKRPHPSGKIVSMTGTVQVDDICQRSTWTPGCMVSQQNIQTTRGQPVNLGHLWPCCWFTTVPSLVYFS